MKQFFSELYKKISMSKPGKAMLKVLARLRIDRFMYFIVDLFDPDFTDKDVEEAKAFFEAHKKDVKDILDQLSDDLSYNTYKCMINYRISGKRRFVLSVCKPVKDRYILRDTKGRIIPVMGDESIADCGAYTGDDLENFVKQKITFREYYAFEPDESNIVEGEKVYSLPGVELFKYAVGEKDEICHFDKGGGKGANPVGKLSDSGSLTVQVKSLDDVLDKRRVTMIKMDIEGAEMAAIKGASNIITEQKPLLAISIYHSNSDMIEILRYIKTLVPEYKFYCRHYSYGYADTILYAVNDR